MSRLLAAAFVAFLILGACGDDSGNDSQTAPQDEDCSQQEVTTDSGLTYVDTKCGTGDPAEQGDIVIVHYTGKLENGKEFDSSAGGEPFQFQLGVTSVIQGWQEGIEGMKEGGERTLTIPPELGYGKAGSPPVIPRNATLIFEVEVLEIEAG